MNRSKKPPKKSPVVERGRNHSQFCTRVMEAVERGEGISHEEVLVLVTEIRDLRALLADADHRKAG
jgi:hypothetical protein